MAIGMSGELSEHGLCVPEDYDVVGYNTIPVALSTMLSCATIDLPAQQTSCSVCFLIENHDTEPQRVCSPMKHAASDCHRTTL
jgi:DNA-binding LacI/PurR family transcriptional regulator